MKFVSDINTLKIDFEKLLKIVDDKISNISIIDFEVNEQIKEKSILLDCERQYRINTMEAINMVRKQGKSLIKNNRKYVIEDEIEFINKKKISLKYSYVDSIKRIESGKYYAKRNTTNNRLDTNLTNMSSLLVNEIAKQNDIVQIDLSNSQFTILSNILKTTLNSVDFLRFKDLCVSGELNDYIKEELGFMTRKQGKKSMFEIMFSSRKNTTLNKKKIKELFPSVIECIDEYKKENGNEKFSIMLQLFESELFIDVILKKIKKQKIF